MEKYQFDPATRALIEDSEVPVAVYQFVDRRVVTLALSAGFCALFGFDDRADAYHVMDHDMYRDTHPDDASRVADIALRFATEGGDYNAIYRTKRGDGYCIVHALGRHIYAPAGERLAVIWYTDEGLYAPDGGAFENHLSESFNRAMRENTLYHENHFDALTGLPGMSYFLELARAGMARMLSLGQQPAMLFFDLCGMKLYNQTNGYAEGDLLIRATARALVKHFSNENCSRFAQDHFAVYTVYTPALEQTLEEIFAEALQFNGGKTLPLRVGIYLPRGDSAEISSACDLAKAACDVNRRSYVSCFHYYDESMMTDALRRQRILEDLDPAIAEGRIAVYYQPIVRAANGRVCSEEALARWTDRAGRMHTPAEFIGVLEDARLIYKLDLHVLELALEKMRQQASDGLYVVPVSINLSRADFAGCDVVAEICRRVDASGLGRDMVNIEITESIIGEDFDFMKAQIDCFHAQGFRVWMDDFGSGYSSLDLLQSIQFDLIKFDLHFMRNFEHSESSRIILTELMKMALSLGVETVVEGVESREQAEFLREIGATMLQGYYYTPPIPLSELRRRYAEGRQIGFENPEESAYYAAIGSVNLFNPGVVSGNSDDLYRQYFDTIPMAVLEVLNEEVTVVRCNHSYRDMLQRVFLLEPPEGGIHNTKFDQQPELDFFNALRQSTPTGEWVQFDRQQSGGYAVHSFVRRLAVNPVSGAVAAVSIVLAMHVQGPAAVNAYEEESSIEHEMHTVSANSVARALSHDYIAVYYINAETSAFHIFSRSPGYAGLGLDERGSDFFTFVRRVAAQMVYPEDQELFTASFSREALLAALAKRRTYALTFRVLYRGEPRYVHVKATRMRDRKHGVLIAVSDIDAQMRERAAYARARTSSVTYAHIAQALSRDYVSIYYVDMETDSFIEYSSHNANDDLSLERTSEDFFGASRSEAQKKIYPEDLARFLAAFTKERITDALERFGVFTLTYRLMVDGAPAYVNLKASRMKGDERHVVIGVSSVDAQMKHQEALERVKEERITYARISALSGDYIAIYTVDPVTTHYIEYSATDDYAELGLTREGDDFFGRSRADVTRILYFEDLDMFLSTFTRENVMDAIARKGLFTLNYRLMIDGKPTYVSLKAGMIEEKDGPQLIVGVVNIDEQIRRDQEYARNLSLARSKANFDALTGVKNKHAYVDVEARLNQEIEEGKALRFALVLCDVNGLKQVNDTLGHQAGDRYLQKARTIICHIFQNSSVFRVGGDEFAVLIQGQDYDNVDAQVAALGDLNRRNAAIGDVVIACGMAKYEGDHSVAAVFERADRKMYENKRRLEGE